MISLTYCKKNYFFSFNLLYFFIFLNRLIYIASFPYLKITPSHALNFINNLKLVFNTIYIIKFLFSFHNKLITLKGKLKITTFCFLPKTTQNSLRLLQGDKRNIQPLTLTFIKVDLVRGQEEPVPLVHPKIRKITL